MITKKGKGLQSTMSPILPESKPESELLQAMKAMYRHILVRMHEYLMEQQIQRDEQRFICGPAYLSHRYLIDAREYLVQSTVGEELWNDMARQVYQMVTATIGITNLVENADKTL